MLSLTGVPAGVGVRRQALPVQLRTLSSGGVAATVRDAGQDLVPEPSQQVETPAGYRAGSGQHGARRRRRAANGSSADCLSPALATRRLCRYPCVRHPTSYHTRRNRKPPSSFPSCVWRISIPTELPRGPLFSAVLQQSMLFSLKHCLIVLSYCNCCYPGVLGQMLQKSLMTRAICETF